MANGRNKNNKGDSGRDSGGFVALPCAVLDCPAYARLSHPAKGLLIEVARQFHRDDNGRMLLSRAYMATRGWKSADTLTNAKRELLEGGFIFQTVMGHRPNKASWYAVTWRALDKLPGYDVGTTQLFERSAYKKAVPVIRASLRPPAGTRRAVIAPPAGTETLPTVPPAGTIEAVLEVLSVPPAGHPLEMPSIAVCIGDVLATMPTGAAPALFVDADHINSATQQLSTSGRITTCDEEVTTECELVAAIDGADAGEDF